MTTVAFIGLGAMGSRMADRLHEAGFALRLHNRNPARMQAFAQRGIATFGSAAQAAAGADFIVSIVADDVATRAVMLGADGVLAGAGAGAVIIDSSTNTPAVAREVAQAAAARGIGYLDAPVSGSIAQAAGRELVFMVGGTADSFEKAAPVFAAMGRMARRIGEAGAGATVKLINNMLSGTVNAAMAEAMLIAEAAGVDPQATQEVLFEGATGCRLMRAKLPKISKRDFSPQFQLSLMDKDLRYFLSLAQDVDRPAPIAALVRSQLQAARLAGYGEQDVSVVFLHRSGGKPA